MMLQVGIGIYGFYAIRTFDLSWLFGIVVAGAAYLVLSRRVVGAASVVTTTG